MDDDDYPNEGDDVEMICSFVDDEEGLYAIMTTGKPMRQKKRTRSEEGTDTNEH